MATKPKEPASIQNLLSGKTVKQLSADLEKKNPQALKDRMTDLFGYREVYNLHPDHLAALAEYIISLGTAGDPASYARETAAYIGKWKQKFYRDREKTDRQWQMARKTYGEDSLEALDLKYRRSCFYEGFYYSWYHSCTLMERLARFVLERSGAA